MSVHDLSEQSKRLLDMASFMLAGISGATILSALNFIAVAMSILAAATSVAWNVYRYRESKKHGTPND